MPIQANGTVFTLNLAPFSVPRSHGPSTVDALSNIAQYKRECIWDPTWPGSALTWIYSYGMKVDPFRANHASIVVNYIERLPPAFHSM
ncbi:hypothetical protein PsorP6_005458 [Peronosclerospora sorghi]|uniref:Uncharacterized protein n=1 Tax=Peronosclerospora sorghi TaxID=230839 RepID=A0ACC0W3A3_9STRA|nr:hypothetical protein PsorP6_005458 [Peronosclerospora sorghi]